MDNINRTSLPIKSALATALGLAIAGAQAQTPARPEIRLVLNDVISNTTTDVPEFAGRIEIDSLIQSHPDPLLTELENRYQALPPFTHATESLPERYILEESGPGLIAGARETVSKIARYVPNIRTMARYDDISERLPSNTNPEQQRQDYQTLVTTINPTFMYEAEQRKWRLRATYDYEHGQYYLDQDSSINDHAARVEWAVKLRRGNELRLSTIAESSHDRVTNDPIQDFDSALESQNIDYSRYLVNVLYKSGTLRDRTRFELNAYKEKSSLDGEDVLAGGYALDRQAVAAKYAWQIRRKVALVGEAKLQQFDYDLSFRDNTQYRALVGTEMILGRRLRADFRVGYEVKRFDFSLGDDSFGDTVWDGMFEWAVRRKTSVKLETGREIFELATVDNPIDAGKFNVQSWVRTAWEEKWSDKLSTNASYTVRQSDYQGRADGEDAEQLVLTAEYRLSNRWTVSLDGAYTRRETDRGDDLNRQTFTLRTDYAL